MVSNLVLQSQICFLFILRRYFQDKIGVAVFVPGMLNILIARRFDRKTMNIRQAREGLERHPRSGSGEI